MSRLSYDIWCLPKMYIYFISSFYLFIYFIIQVALGKKDINKVQKHWQLMIFIYLLGKEEAVMHSI